MVSCSPDARARSRENVPPSFWMRVFRASSSRWMNRSATPDCHTSVPARMACTASSSAVPAAKVVRSAAHWA